VSARYDRRPGRVVISLSSGIDVMFAPQAAEGLGKASPAELEKIEISPSGFGIRFRSWMWICICRRCSKGFWDRGSGWPEPVPSQGR
jgi:hypothetical protein